MRFREAGHSTVEVRALPYHRIVKVGISLVQQAHGARPGSGSEVPRWDVVVAGAGPAGSIAATLLARAGARVLLLDRARFPREKLCGDTVNPGTVARLRALSLAGWIETHGLAVEGMLVTGPSGIRIEGRYPPPLLGRAARRTDLDYWLLCQAIGAGVRFEERVTVRRALVAPQHHGPCATRVAGVLVDTPTSRGVSLAARITIAADGRRSPLAFGLGLASHPQRPRRWAIGGHFESVSDNSALGEMHIKTNGYIGVAPLPDGLTNVCVVTSQPAIRPMSDPEKTLRAAIDGDAQLRDRFLRAHSVAPTMVLGPLAVDVSAAAVPGLLFAGDAAGFVDPMTGDGLRFAVQGAELAADAAIEILATGRSTAHASLVGRRRAAFARKLRFNRVLRRIVDSPFSLRLAEACASRAPALILPLINIAGDCGLAVRSR